MSIKDLSKIHTAAALVSVMGSESDKGNYDKYMKADMEKNVLEHEPGIALFVPDEEPLKFYRAIA